MTVPTAEVAPAPGDPRRGTATGRRRHRRVPLRRLVRELGLALITVGIVILLFVAYQLFGTNLVEASSQSSLEKGFDAAVAAAKAASHHPATSTQSGTGNAGRSGNPGAATPALPAVPPGGAIDHLVIPKIGVDKYVVQGYSESDLRRGPGHYPQTVMPGQDGNASIAGHRTTYGAPFFRLNELNVGDPIYITDTTGRTYLYKVSQPPEVVNPDDLAVLDPTTFAELTLTTCNPRFSAATRLIIVARLAGTPPTPAAGPPAQTQQAPPVSHTANLGAVAPALGSTGTLGAASLGAGEPGAWPAALGYGVLALLAWVLTRVLVARTRRWARAGAFVVGVAVCLVPLWFCFENAILLLPQSI
ncbi:MAG: class E sortase [Acidimicrobiales bacterium]